MFGVSEYAGVKDFVRCRLCWLRVALTDYSRTQRP